MVNAGERMFSWRAAASYEGTTMELSLSRSCCLTPARRRNWVGWSPCGRLLRL